FLPAAITAVTVGALFLASQPLGVIGLLPVAILPAAGQVWMITDAALIARRQGSGYRLKPYNRWYVYLVTIACVRGIAEATTAGARAYIVQAYFIPDSSAMAPTLRRG